MSSAPDPQDFAKAARSARRSWATIADAGGLLTVPDIARRWGVGPQTVREAVRREDFPGPVATIARSEVWLAPEVDQWRATPRKVGRPRKDRDTA